MALVVCGSGLERRVRRAEWGTHGRMARGGAADAMGAAAPGTARGARPGAHAPSNSPRTQGSCATERRGLSLRPASWRADPPGAPHSTESPQKAEPRTLASLRTGSTAKSNTMSPDSAEYQGREGSAQRGPGSARSVSAPGKEARGTPPILDASSTQLRAHPAAPSPPAEPCTPLRTCVSTHDAQHLGQGLLAG